ncbi:MAG: Gfo/Idh/MocA family oxidoreductase [Elusimicrobiaceae bacterium]|nr:Gfo/Idh/MocA family oxidoreductase [Elusimicrobiaceae bacterium]
MKTLNVAVIGFGFMGKTHTYGYKTIPLYYEPDFNIRLAAVCSGRYENALAAQERYGFEHACHNLEEVLSLPDIDIIDICTPNAQHAQAILQALDHHKHIYCEKPVACGEEETQRILAHPNLTRVTTQTAFNNRFIPAAKLAKKLMDENRLGKILSFRTHMIMPSHIDPTKPARWRNSRQAAGGGTLYDLGAHVIDMLTWLAGPVARVYTKNQTAYATRPDGKGGICPIDTDDASYSVVTLQNGAVGTVEANKLATGTNTDLFIEIHGEKGALKIDFMDGNWLYFYDVANPLAGYTRIETVQKYSEVNNFPPSRHPLGWIRGHADSLYTFLQAVHQEKQSSPSIAEGLEVQKVLDAMYRSADTNQEVCL